MISRPAKVTTVENFLFKPLIKLAHQPLKTYRVFGRVLQFSFAIQKRLIDKSINDNGAMQRFYLTNYVKVLVEFWAGNVKRQINDAMSAIAGFNIQNLLDTYVCKVGQNWHAPLLVFNLPFFQPLDYCISLTIVLPVDQTQQFQDIILRMTKWKPVQKDTKS